jgi:hypothetical protein
MNRHVRPVDEVERRKLVMAMLYSYAHMLVMKLYWGLVQLFPRSVMRFYVSRTPSRDV